jgi:hypothetical protein
MHYSKTEVYFDYLIWKNNQMPSAKYMESIRWVAHLLRKYSLDIYVLSQGLDSTWEHGRRWKRHGPDMGSWTTRREIKLLLQLWDLLRRKTNLFLWHWRMWGFINRWFWRLWSWRAGQRFFRGLEGWDSTSLCSPGWPPNHDPLASPSQELRLQEWSFRRVERQVKWQNQERAWCVLEITSRGPKHGTLRQECQNTMISGIRNQNASP